MDDVIDISMDFDKKPHFGGGIELLMNESKSSRSRQSVELDDLDNLESELNDLTNHNSGGGSSGGGGGYTFFGLDEDKPPSVHFTEPETIRLDTIPDEYQPQSANEKTWDGYGKFNDIPVNPDVPSNRSSVDQPIPANQMLKKKKSLLSRLKALEKKGVELNGKYDENSDIQEIMAELEVQAEEVSRMESIKVQGQAMLAFVNGIEYLNKKFNPFDLELDGFGDQVNENIQDFDDMFAELHNKYKDKVYVPVELRILGTLAGSGALIHFSNTMMKNVLPGMDDIFRQDPQLARQFQTAALNSLHKTSPGFANFMGGSANQNQNTSNRSSRSMFPNSSSGAPPAPINTRDHNMPQPASNRGGNHIPPIPNANSQHQQQHQHQQQQQSFRDDIHIYDQQQQQRSEQPVYKSAKRPDMKGPSDVSSILSGLRTKTIEIDNIGNHNQDTYELKSTNGDSSPSSVAEQTNNGVKRSNKRKPRSDKNIVSLDL